MALFTTASWNGILFDVRLCMVCGIPRLRDGASEMGKDTLLNEDWDFEPMIRDYARIHTTRTRLRFDSTSVANATGMPQSLDAVWILRENCLALRCLVG